MPVYFSTSPYHIYADTNVQGNFAFENLHKRLKKLSEGLFFPKTLRYVENDILFCAHAFASLLPEFFFFSREENSKRKQVLYTKSDTDDSFYGLFGEFETFPVIQESKHLKLKFHIENRPILEESQIDFH